MSLTREPSSSGLGASGAVARVHLTVFVLETFSCHCHYACTDNICLFVCLLNSIHIFILFLSVNRPIYHNSTMFYPAYNYVIGCAGLNIST